MKKLFTILTVLLFLAPFAAHADITTGLVGWWTFDEGTWYYAFDYSGNGNTATNYGGWTTGEIGPYALSLSGSSPQDAYIAATPPAALTFGYNQAFSLSGWENISTFTGGNYPTIYSQDSTSGKFQYETYIDQNTHKAGGEVCVSFVNCWGVESSAILTGTWYLVTMTYDGSTVTLYLNGVSQGTASYGGGAVSNPDTVTTIGSQNNSSNWFPGNLDDVRVYNRALSGSDVTQLYAYTAPSASVAGLIVGGGGAGGQNVGGAGGGGGYEYNSVIPVTPQTYTVTVGAGGAAGAGQNNGANSVFSVITSYGGGAGGQAYGSYSSNGIAGGSGGGASGFGSAGGTGSQGGSGGAGASGAYPYATGGGGGAGGNGGSSSGSVSGNGGNGIANSISGSSVTYAGGGGGGGFSGATAGSGGTGGGGNGAAGSLGTGGDGTANLGGGGGGSGGSYSNGGNGGSGIVILSAPTSAASNYSCTNCTITTSGGNTIYTFTSSGTWTYTPAATGIIFPRLTLLSGTLRIGAILYLPQ